MRKLQLSKPLTAGKNAALAIQSAWLARCRKVPIVMKESPTAVKENAS